jgi:TrmH family RNA methyltransferase
MITSADNPKLKEARKLADRRWRDRLGRFVAEGEDLVDAAAAAGWHPVFVLRAGHDVEPSLLDEVSVLGSGSRVIAAYVQRWAAEATAPCIALWGVHDPGNVGTVLRSAAAFGAQSVALGPECADPYGPKAVRASMGAIFSVPVVRVEGPGDLPAPRAAMVARRGSPIEEAGAIASLIVGGERAGVPEAVVAECEQVVHVPIETESLNAAMAATVGLYEVHRMRRHA